jgi:hypothetical protein
MSQLRLTPSERIQALERVGYREREAAFLCLAALHGGYFLRRQYAAFLDKTAGGNAASLIERLLEREHARVMTFGANTHVYHLSARPFYAALGQEDNRNRRLRQPATIRQKLMALDFVLSHPNHRYLATEQEKLGYFAGELDVARTLLPGKQYVSGRRATWRYFIEKFPIFLSPSSQAATPPVVSFCFIDEGSATTAGFASFLQLYGPLLMHLRQFEVLYVAVHESHFKSTAEIFSKWFDGALEGRVVGWSDTMKRELLAYFDARRRYENRQLTSFDRASLIRLREARQEYSAPAYEALYRRWRSGGEEALEALLKSAGGSGPTPTGHFSTYRLEHSYAFFGTVAA